MYFHELNESPNLVTGFYMKFMFKKQTNDLQVAYNVINTEPKFEHSLERNTTVLEHARNCTAKQYDKVSLSIFTTLINLVN